MGPSCPAFPAFKHCKSFDCMRRVAYFLTLVLEPSISFTSHSDGSLYSLWRCPAFDSTYFGPEKIAKLFKQIYSSLVQGMHPINLFFKMQEYHDCAHMHDQQHTHIVCFDLHTPC